MRATLPLLVALVGCRPTGSSTPPPPPNPFETQPYASGPLAATTKVFLVAGGDDVANFAAEVLEQRTLWRKAGLREDEIACYYAKPTDEAWRRDRRQFEQLAVALRSCRAASAEQLADDLAIAAQGAPDFVYLYVSSHGLPSQLRSLEASSRARTQRFVASLDAHERAVLEPAAIGLEAKEPGLGEPRAIVRALRDHVVPESLVFTPRTLATMLAPFDPAVPTTIVLQACFSGGFIDHHAPGDPDPAPGSDALLARPNLTVLTATATERPSFGCGSGQARTYFGGAYNKALERALQAHEPTTLPWEDIHAQVTFAVEAMEHVEGQRASLPGFVSQGATSDLDRPMTSP
ncbi:MAG: caspase family protein [Myxococcota bacterium]